MARVPEAELERIKREVSVERLAAARGVELSRHGADLLGLCPFHADREPSLVISPAKNLWHCLGACQTGGSAIDWVMKAEGVSFRHAVELLRADGTAGSRSGGEPPKRSTVQKLPRLLAPCAQDAVLLGRVVDYYHATLKQSPEALGYLASRGLEHPEMVARFRLGFANRTLGYRLPAKTRQEGAEVRERLQRLGVLRSSGHEHLAGSLVIPVFDAQGRVVELYGRKITSSLRAGTARHLYLPGPHRGVWNWEAVQASREIILCESLIDALTFWCAGYRNVTAAYGVEGMTSDHWSALERSGTQRVLIAYDRDEAGERATSKLAQALEARGIGASRIQFPKGLDANAYAQKLQPASRSLGLVIRKAIWLGKGAEPTRPTDAATPVLEEAAKGKGPVESVAVAESASPHATPELDASEPPTATPEPAPPEPAVPVDSSEGEVVLGWGDRRWRVRGLAKNTSLESLRVNVLVTRESAVDAEASSFHVDTLDLYSARQRTQYVAQASEELGVEARVLKKELGQVLLRLEALQEQQLKAVLDPEPARVELSEEDRESALALLRDPALLDRILVDFERCGVVGERTNKLVGYLAAVSRKLESPLGVVIQSSSAAGKSALMEAVLALMPEEERVQYSAMTGQSLFYMSGSDLRHKILAIVEEEGAERASYALKLLQSEGHLTIASTGKDPTSGRLVTHEYRVEGPVMIFLTTTAIEIDEELLNRCLVLTVDEGREQTRAIHRRQRESQTLEGLLLRQEREQILRLHRSAQRLLRPLLVANPHALDLRFLDHATRTRRDHMKYLTLIRAIALLHQYQREVKTVEHGGERLEYIEVTASDIELADRLLSEVLRRSLDELPPQTRRLLELLEAWVGERAKGQGVDREDVRFTRREVREHTGWGHTQLKVHLHRLEELEYLEVHSGGPRQRLVYALVAGANPTRCAYDSNWSGSEAPWSGSGRPLVGPPPRPEKLNGAAKMSHLVGVNGKSLKGAVASGASYAQRPGDA